MSFAAVAVVAAAAGAAKVTTGIIKTGKANKLAKELDKTRPDYAISQLAKDDLALAQSEASIGGLSSRAETAYNNLNNQQFSSSLSAILKGGGSANNVGDVYGSSQEGRQRLALLNDQMRLQKIGNLMRTREMYRGEQDKAWEHNEWKPWADKSQANAIARKESQNLTWDGVGDITNAAMNFAGAKGQAKQYNQFLDRAYPQQSQQGNTPGLSNAANFNFSRPQQQQQSPNNFNYDMYNQISSNLNGEIF